MKNIKVSKKLMIGFAIVVALSVAIGITGVVGLLSMGNAATDMYTNKAEPLGDLATAMEYFQRLRVQTRNAIIYTGNMEELDTVEVDLNDRFDVFESSMEAYYPSIATEDAIRLFDDIMENYEKIVKPGIQVVLEDARQGLPSMDLMVEMAGTTEAANTIARELTELTQSRMNVMSGANQANQRLGTTLLIVILAVILVAVVVSVFLARYISNLICRPLLPLTAVMKRAGALGDLALEPSDQDVIESCSRRKDELGELITSAASFIRRTHATSEELKRIAGGDLSVQTNLLSEKDITGHAIQTLLTNLNQMFGEIRGSANQVSTGSKQIADGAQTLAQGSTEQASAVEQLSASMSQIAVQTSENAGIAREAADLSGHIKENAEKGRKQMEQMMRAVQEINEASGEIRKVIKVIDDIAFQTNILALNAAVEAACAGQHGKGFAVVAEEVRNLAGKSADAAKNSGSLIENSVAKANLGIQIATETSASLNDIVDGILRSAEIVAKIAQSSDQQAAAISQVNTGIDQVAQVVQLNSATAEESAAASEEMSSQSSLLEQLTSRFKLLNMDGYTPSLASTGNIDLPYASGENDYGKY